MEGGRGNSPVPLEAIGLNLTRLAGASGAGARTYAGQFNVAAEHYITPVLLRWH
jgi:hypothetical protein